MSFPADLGTLEKYYFLSLTLRQTRFLTDAPEGHWRLKSKSWRMRSLGSLHKTDRLMNSPDTRSKPATSKPVLGFLTVHNDPQHGFFGGYLVLDLLGRPLEFHCTAPIKPNRAQEILYGPTLESFIYGEQIGQTLLGHSSREPAMVCTDCEPAMAVRQYVSWPVVLVLPPEQPIVVEKEQRLLRFDCAHGGGPNLLTFQLGRNRLALPAKAEAQRRAIEEQHAELLETFDLTEPFTRIREAIEEAQQAVR